MRERVQILDLLAHCHRSLADGEGSATFIVGEPGMGKTTVLDEVRATDPSCRVMRCCGRPTETGLPFALVDSLIGDQPSFVPDGPNSPMQRRAVVHNHVMSTVRAAAAQSRLIVIVDDLQWADADSLTIIASIAARARSTPIMFVAALRPWPAAGIDAVEALVAVGDSTRVTLQPFGFDTTRAVLTAALDFTPSVDLTTRAFDLSQGNPMLIGEAARHVSDKGDLPDIGDGERTGRLRRLLLQSMRGMSGDARRVADAAAILGRRSRLATVEKVAGLTESRFATAVDELVGGVVLQECPADAGEPLADSAHGWVEFRHDLVAAAVRVELPPGQARLLHMRAYAFHRERDDIESSAHHALAADLAGEPGVIEVVGTAGRRALERGAVASALRQLTGALRLAGGSPPAWLRTLHADALFVAGSPGAAAEEYWQILSDAPTAKTVDRRSLLVRRAQAQAYAGSFDEAVAAYDELIGTVEGGMISVPLLLERAHVIWEQDGPLAGLVALDPDRAEALDHAERTLFAAARGLYLLHAGDDSEIASLYVLESDDRVRGANSVTAVAESFTSFLVLASMYFVLERFDDAVDVIDRGAAHWRDVGAPLSAIPLSLIRCGIDLHRGALRSVVEQEADEFAIMLPLLAPAFALLRAQALAWMGDIAAAEAECTRVADMPGITSLTSHILRADTAGLLLLLTNRLDEAVAVYDDLAATCRRTGWRNTSLGWAHNAIEVFVAAGRTESVAEIVDDLDATLATPWRQLVQAGARADLAAAAGRHDAADLYADALRPTVPAPIDRARIALRFGRYLRRSHRLPEAREALADALRACEQCGADHLAVRVHAELNAAGGRRRAGAAGLTPQQSRAAGLASGGSTIREIAEAMVVSPRTVESHLAIAYRVLGVANKQELQRRRHEWTL